MFLSYGTRPCSSSRHSIPTGIRLHPDVERAVRVFPDHLHRHADPKPVAVDADGIVDHVGLMPPGVVCIRLNVALARRAVGGPLRGPGFLIRWVINVRYRQDKSKKSATVDRR
jgi:hypothetical protein